MFEKYYENPVKCGGTFVEIGALDGLLYSNSYFFEHALGWKSLLVEANPENYKKLKKNRPNAMTVHAAMCRGESIKFQGKNAVGGDISTMPDEHKNGWVSEKDTIITVLCRNWKSLFQENSITHIDVFIIDVEGGEHEVLSVMDWSVPVDNFIIEMASDKSGARKNENVRSILKLNGYEPVRGWKISDWCDPQKDCTSNEVFQRRIQHQ